MTDLADRIFESLVAGMELLTIDLGRRLGLYQAVHRLGTVNSAELAAEAGIAERYAREWLEQQAAAGFIAVAEAGDELQRRYEIPSEHEPVLLDEESPLHMMGAAPMMVGCGLALPALPAVYRSGGGVAYEEYGEEIRHGIGTFNRPGFIHDLPEWIGSMTDVTSRLRDGAVVLDAGCGTGWSSIAIAEAFPNVEVVGVDMDTASIEDARRNVSERGLEDRVHFEVANATAIGELAKQRKVQFDFALIFEALHDMGDPVGVLAAIRGALTSDGVILIGDEHSGDEFTANAGEIERLQYAFSVLHCLPATMAESTHIANGTVLRPGTVRGWAEAAGCTFEELPLGHDFWRFYRLDKS
ncbi:class I SAM-dependent methyltransferase [Antrihabitans spumae]|uniref:Class I SAM-dependent methyltransferase n=1 Tax=Antrihabitans spumae TaxID=3373370 RepID=A0ABW7JPI9_9NOCA